MFINFFRSPQFGNLLMLPLVLLVMWVFIIPKPEIGNTENAFPLFLYALQYTAHLRTFLIGASLAMIVMQAYLLTEVINRQNVLKENTHLPALLYVVLMSCFPEQLSFNPLLFANFFIIIFLNSLFNLYQADNATLDGFDAGLFIGIASLFYWPSFFLFPLAYAGLILLRSFNWKEWFAPLLGLAAPLFFFATILYWFDRLSISSIRSILEPFYGVQFTTIFNSSYLLLILILTAVVLAALVRFSQEVNTFAKIRTRKFLTLLIWFLLFASLSYLVSVKKTMISVSFLAIPMSVVVSNYFISLRKRLLAEIIFIVLLVAVVYNQVQFFLKFST